MSLSSGIKSSVKGCCFFCLETIAPFFDRSASLEKSNVRRVLVIEGGGVGDLVGILPAIESLHKNFPDASISLLASPSSSGVLKLYPPASSIIDELISYEPRGRHKSFGAKMRLIRSLRKEGFDLSYAPGRGEGMREVMFINYLIGAPMRLGFRQGKTGFLNTCTVEFRGDLPILMQNLEILRAQGLEVTADGVDLKVPEKALESAERFLASSGIERETSFIVIHPGAAWNGALRCWPVEKYIKLMRALTKELALKIVVIGSKSERGTGERIFRELSEEASIINAIGETSLLEMAGIISLSNLFIGNDSGPLHLAQAFSVSSVAIFGYTSPEQVIWRKEKCVSVESTSTTRRRYLHQYDYKSNPGDAEVLDLVSVEDVMAGVRRAAAAGI